MQPFNFTWGESAKPKKSTTHYSLLTTHWRQRRPGFTLIELLIVISIIGILVTMTMSSYGRLQAKTRDTQRKNDIDQVIKAITAYVGDNGIPPLTDGNYGGNGVCVAGQLIFGCPFTGVSGSPIYMNKVPTAPKQGAAACGEGDWAGAVACRYWYFQYVPAGAGCTNSILFNKPYVSTYLESDKGNGDDCGAGFSARGLYFKEP